MYGLMESRRFSKLFPSEIQAAPRPRTPVTPTKHPNPHPLTYPATARGAGISGSGSGYQHYEAQSATVALTPAHWERQPDPDKSKLKTDAAKQVRIGASGAGFRQSLHNYQNSISGASTTTSMKYTQSPRDPDKDPRLMRRPKSRSPSFTSAASAASSPRSNPFPVPIMYTPREEPTRSSNVTQAPVAKRFLDPTTFKFKCTVSATISDAMRRRGWKQADDHDDSWNIYWCDMGQLRELYYRLSKPLEENQRIGHFRNSFEVSRKNLMARNLRRFKARVEKQFGKAEGEKLNFFPQTFILPDEHSKFLDEFRRDPTVWVIKPAAGAQGRGIFIFSKLKDYYIWRAAFDPIECQRRRLAADGIQMKTAADEKAVMSSMPQLDSPSQSPRLNKYVPPIIGPGGVYLAPSPTANTNTIATGSDTTFISKTGVDVNNNEVEPDNMATKQIMGADQTVTLLSNYVEPPESEVIQAGNAKALLNPNGTSTMEGSTQRRPTSASTSTQPEAFLEPEPSTGDTDDDTDDTGVDTSAGSTTTTTPPARHEIFVVQKYILNPYLLGGRKFDLRLYVLVESIAPLKVWVHREGFARFSGGQYNVNTLQDIYVHLTNVAIQKTSDNYDSERGSKWPLYELRAYLLMAHGQRAVHDLFSSIDNIIIRTLQSAQHAIYPDRHCFEVYGFDILIDSALKAWLLEVNSSPAFTPSSEQDYRLKCALIDDVVHVLDLEKRLTGFEKRVGGFDLIWNAGPVYSDDRDNSVSTEPTLNSFIGCHNDRVNQLFNLFQLTSHAYGVQSLNAVASANQDSNGELKPQPTNSDNQITIPDFHNSNSKPKVNTYTRAEFNPIDIAGVARSPKDIDPNYKVPEYPNAPRGASRSTARVANSGAFRNTTTMNYGVNRGYATIPTPNELAQLVNLHPPTLRPPSREHPSKVFARTNYTQSTTAGAMPVPSNKPSPAPLPYKAYVNNVFNRLSGSGTSFSNRKYK